ncbi:MAG: AI-2E family transporter [Ruminococcus sp.]|nr:AI-2E family transporter [Ruminococcus sp.]
MYNNYELVLLRKEGFMKFYTNKKYNTIAFYAILVVALNVLLIIAILRFQDILNIFSALFTVLLPVIWGFAIAFLVNPIMVTFEDVVQKKIIKKPASQGNKKRKWLRILSVFISSVIFLGIVGGVISIIVPELINSVNDVINNSSDTVETSKQWINKLFANYPKISKILSDRIAEFSTDLGNLQPMLENILSGALGFVNLVKNFVLGFILSIYLLFNKETLVAQLKKIMFANLKKSTCGKLFRFGNQANKVFSGFITGKIVDSIIIGFISFVVLTIVNMPYNILISVIIGVTNIIPFFGPFIGAIPSALLILLVEPRKVIIFLIIVLLIQQFDGNVLGPKILGDSTGLPAIWVMISLFIGGGMFGFIGMLISVPAFALIYSLIRDGIDNKLKNKKLPLSTEYYKDDHKRLLGSEKKKFVPLTPEELSKIDIPSISEANEAK